MCKAAGSFWKGAYRFLAAAEREGRGRSGVFMDDRDVNSPAGTAVLGWCCALMDVYSVPSLVTLPATGELGPSLATLEGLMPLRDTLYCRVRIGVVVSRGEVAPDTSEAVGDEVPPTACRFTAFLNAAIHAFRSAWLSAFSRKVVLSRKRMTKFASRPVSVFREAPSKDSSFLADSPSCRRYRGL